MKSLVEKVLGLIVAIGWIAGIVLAKGFGGKMFAFVIPPYAWYKVVEKFMQLHGWV